MAATRDLVPTVTIVLVAALTNTALMHGQSFVVHTQYVIMTL